MRTTAFAKPCRNRLQHDPLRDADFAQSRNLLLAHDTRVDVWQQAGFPENQRANRFEIIDRGSKAEFAQRLPCGAITKFWLVTEREQGFAASRLLASPRNRQDIFGR